MNPVPSQMAIGSLSSIVVAACGLCPRVVTRVFCAHSVARMWAVYLLATCFLTAAAHGLTIELNYDYDTNGFFDNPEARQALEFAMQAFTPLTDQLLAIESSGGNSWTARITHPGSGAANFPITNPIVGAGTLLVFVGGHDLADTQVGLGGPGGWQAQASGDFIDILRNRGQGITKNTNNNFATAVDFGPWGGAISFDTTEPDGTSRDWHYGIDTAPATGQTDFLSIAVHELGHVFGFGLSDAYDNQISEGTFQGPATMELYGGIGVPVVPGHWASGTESPPYSDPPRAAMGGSIVLGSRTPFTPLDYAALKDTGWEVPDALLELPGDVNGDQVVNGSDYLQWQRSNGLTSGGSQAMGDLDGDADVDHYDSWILRRNLGMIATNAIQANAIQAATLQVPEPTAIGLTLIGFWAFLGLCHRKMH